MAEPTFEQYLYFVLTHFESPTPGTICSAHKEFLRDLYDQRITSFKAAYTFAEAFGLQLVKADI
jgi:hypothetical protein